MNASRTLPRTALRCGVDVVDLERFRRMLALRGDALLRAVYCEREAEQCAGLSARLAACFAAKEATAKALGCGIGGEESIGWREIETVSDADGVPGLALSGRAAELAEEFGLRIWRISLSHESGVALALVVAGR